jgi:hypothetical protein
MKALTTALGTLFVSVVGFCVGAVSGFLLAIALHLHAPGEVAGIGGLFNGIASGIFYGLICGVASAILAGILAFRLFKSS